MGKYKLILANTAYLDLEQIYAYIAKTLSAPNAANNLMGKIESKIRDLQVFPISSPFCNDESLKLKGYRKLVVNNYIVIYKVDELTETVHIIRILYGASDYERQI